MSNPVDRTNGEQLLASYYQMSGLVFQGTTFDQFKQYYDTVSPPGGQSGGFIEALGYAQRTSGLSNDEFRSVLQDIASQNTGQFPDYRDFIPAIIDRINGVAHTLKLAAEGTIDGVKQAAEVVAGVGATYLVVVGVIAAMLLYHESRG